MIECYNNKQPVQTKATTNLEGRFYGAKRTGASAEPRDGPMNTRCCWRRLRDFARREIVPIAAEFDESGEFPLRTVRMMGEMGLMGIEMPEQYGGAGMDTLAHVLTMIEIAKADASHSTILSVHNSLYCYPILTFGTEAQKREWITPVASGEEIGAYSLTEPMSGSDAGNMASRAILNDAGSHYIISGRKSWVTSGPVADRLLLFTMTAAEARHRGITAFLIDTSKPGFQSRQGGA